MFLSPNNPFIKIYRTLLLFAFIMLSGTVGYMLTEHYGFFDALYMTVITVSTVGYGEVKPLSQDGRAFTMILILVNIGAFTYFIAQLTSYFLDGEFTREYKSYKMKTAIDQLDKHVIICGYGRNGREAARVLSKSSKDFVVIEKMHERNEDTGTIPVKFYMHDDATRDETLLAAGIKKADALIATLPEDADNLFVVLTARELNPHLKIISRASHDSSVKKLKTAGANSIIMPDKIGGVHMANLVLSPDIKEFVDIIATQNTEHFKIKEIQSEKTISLQELDCWRRTGATILGIKNATGEYLLNPPANTIIRPGQMVIVMGSKEQEEKLVTLLT